MVLDQAAGVVADMMARMMILGGESERPANRMSFRVNSVLRDKGWPGRWFVVVWVFQHKFLFDESPTIIISSSRSLSLPCHIFIPTEKDMGYHFFQVCLGHREL
ncbi:predicted protein [Coccidioides posadasii str. Silveira]|uniref:Predicted protein n=2 Tax=Coccidioides posadasii TaxID=199306 RepID=E9D0R8_COCPS|nr:predicted protein [Coccidioides posadasii str. Silveira]KMM73508.1 hypothetical protein CPAG_09796 [Coccidioides posadasii RMSCC 3488]